MDTFDAVEGLTKKNDHSSKSKIPLILLLIAIIILLVCLVLLVVIITKTNLTNEKKEDKTGKAPLIGLTGKRVPTNPNETQTMTEDTKTTDQIQIHYIQAIERAGGIPMGLPVLQKFDRDVIKRQIESVDALIIQGGLDVDPSFYNEERDSLLGQTNIKTDQFIIEAINQARERKIPILGICRGLQIINVAFGGNLYQDLSRASIEVKNHRQESNEMCEVKHNIIIQNNTLMAKMFPNNKIMGVNSRHHQAIKKLADDLEIDALAEDGKIIEAIHYKGDDQWIFGVQFHPEQLLRCGNENFLKIFTEFIEQAKKKRDSN